MRNNTQESFKPGEIEKLKNAAVDAKMHSFAPYSTFQVGAAVLADSGKIYHGCNIENDSFSLTICAERCAIFKAISEGEKSIRAIAVAIPADNLESTVPCGACRQVMSQFADELLVVIITRSETKTMWLSELFPNPFRLKD
ncbi:MAG: cytidine deaminase [Candidatus Heimdallarchaeota archaeon]